jgi:ribosomal protein S18 acetylase RimI-like enzyme
MVADDEVLLSFLAAQRERVLDPRVLGCARPGYCEVSWVCTHPDARRRGYAAFVTAHVADEIRARGEVPFLHLAASNETVRAVYERLGFRLRRPVALVVVRPPADDEQTVTPTR